MRRIALQKEITIEDERKCVQNLLELQYSCSETWYLIKTEIGFPKRTEREMMRS